MNKKEIGRNQFQINNEEIRKRIRRLREKSNYTQAQLAEALDYADYTSIAKIESGSRQLPLDGLGRLSKMFHVSTDYILFGTEYDSDKDSLKKIEALLETINALFQEMKANR